jgi:uncharacterized coiled-coil protein SlyX
MLGAGPRTPAERSIDELSAQLRELRARNPRPTAQIRRLEQRLAAAWRNVQQMREGTR